MFKTPLTVNSMIIRKIGCFLVAVFLLFSCDKSEEFLADVEVQDFVWKGLNAYYLNQDEVPDLSDRKFNSDIELKSYLQQFTPEDLFNHLKLSNDNTSILLSDYNQITSPIPRGLNTTGMEFGVIEQPMDDDLALGYVSHILPNSYASNQTITRGEFFHAIIDAQNDTIALETENFQELLIDYPQDTLKLLMADFDGLTITPNNKRVDLVKEGYTYPPIYINKTFRIGTHNIGYLMYNNDFSSNYITNLNDAFLGLQNQGVNELILDLRYNIGGGGFDTVVTELASMITGQFANEPLIKEQWNIKAQPWFQQHQPDSVITRFPTRLSNQTSINSLNLQRVYIVLNGGGYTASSSIELLVNSLSPYIDVQIIGNTTPGNNIGYITLYDSADYDEFGRNANHTYALQPRVLRFFNNEDVSYDNGIQPSISQCPVEDILDLGELGEQSDPLLNNLISLITTGSTLPQDCNPFGFTFLYNSIDAQRVLDRGVFIRQDLPNTD